MSSLAAFHFLRPWILLALVPLAAMWWFIRTRHTGSSTASGPIAPHLAKALSVGQNRRFRLLPIDLSSGLLALLILGTSGPTWSVEPSPFTAQTAPLAVVLQVTPSMDNPDIAPSRLERAKHKILDLAELRSGARTALIAFSGTAHSVLPMTEDAKVLRPYLEGLEPSIMPREGFDLNAAEALANDILAREDTPGGILYVLDALPAAEASSLSLINSTAFLFASKIAPNTPKGTQSLIVSADDSDIRQIERTLASAYRQALTEEGSQPWKDRGNWLAWPAALLLLLWFRRGTSMRWAVIAGFALMFQGAPAQAGWRDWFFTPDQQGWLLYQHKDYSEAAETFADPYLRGIALYKSGQYETAAELLARIDSADAAFAAGMAHLKSRKYRDSVQSFERALEIDPTHPGANANLPVSREIVAFIEELRATSDTGEEAGIGADDVVYDNESGRGQDTTVSKQPTEQSAPLSAEQWMNTVDTRTGDFLRQRFLLETARR
ncbi:VWA domain-containing protein [Shimia haliotis]|uniref:Ca-activated chloride channel family protein n=1 Tax=Shimia haliotis TaxID=1280847 RepID=A0A1I4HHC5_9RHOB|nr:VWA domain-containing protein [Shimia haliotis]SFL40786.1 Ca-activated chloride channel family protein [Shimia haliotis]